MALTRKLLSALGIEADKIEQIIEAHTETVDALKNERDSFKSKADSYDKVKTELDQLKETAKNGGDYAKLKQDFDDYKAAVEKEKTDSAKKEALQKIAKDAGLSEAGIAKAVKYSDLSGIELDDKGGVKDGKALLKSLREEWSEYIVKEVTQGADTGNPPVGASGKSYKTKEEIFAIKDTAERQKAIAENHELFGF